MTNERLDSYGIENWIRRKSSTTSVIVVRKVDEIGRRVAGVSFKKISIGENRCDRCVSIEREKKEKRRNVDESTTGRKLGQFEASL